MSVDPVSQVTWVMISVAAVLLLAAVVRRPNVILTTRAGGLEALRQIQDWSKWMAGIQTAGFAALALLVFDKDAAAIRQMDDLRRLFAIAGFVYLGLALFCTAWVLSALPSHAIRLYHTTTDSDAERKIVFDIYEQPLFGWSKRIKLAYMLAVKHWLWAIGLLSLASYCVTLLVSPPAISPADKKPATAMPYPCHPVGIPRQ